jgi:hypothetical protein
MQPFAPAVLQRWLGLLLLMLGLALTLALPLTWGPVAYADGPGSLDLTFNATGIVIPNPQSPFSESPTLCYIKSV